MTPSINLHIRLCPGCHLEYVGCDGSRLTITCEDTGHEGQIQTVQDAIDSLNQSSETLKQATEEK